MSITLRSRLALALVSMFLLPAVVGGAGVLLLHDMSAKVDAILRENYRSVNYMERLNEALERIDSSFNFALSDREEQADSQYDANWKLYDENLALEHANITLPEERGLATRLGALSERYRRLGDAFFALPSGDARRIASYHDHGGLFELFKELKTVSGEIRRINQDNMEQASARARQSAEFSTTLLAVCLITAALLTGVSGWYMSRSVLQPIRSVTESARAISAGNLDQVVPVVSSDELGELAEAFNVMARHLREYRRSQLDQLLRAQRTSQAAIDSFPDSILVIDVDGRVEMANPAARRLLGVLPVAPGQPAGAWVPPESLRGPLADALQGRRDYLPEGFDHALTIGGGERDSVVLPRILTIRDPHDNTLGAALVLQDVTRLRLLDEVKSNLVATASHELKTPLTGIRLAVHLLLEETVGPLTPKQTELLLDARDNSERLLAVVNNLLDLARLEQGSRQLDVRPESPRTLLRHAADAVRARAQDKSIELAVEAPDDLPNVDVDVDRIGHALGNLLDNALEYTDRGGRVTLSAARDDDGVVLAVTDTGIGIPSDQLPHVFEKFFRVPGQSRGTGTGLGLAIVREIAVAHGGTITCESRVGEGTTFRLRLPTAAGETTSDYVVGRVGVDPPASG